MARGRRNQQQDEADIPKAPGAQAKRLQVLRRLIPMMRPHAGRFALATLMLLIGSSLTLVYPQAAREAIDAGISNASPAKLNGLAIGLVFVFILNAAVTWARHYLMSWLGERVVADLRSKVYDKLLQQPLSWFHDRPSGELTGRLAADVGTPEMMAKLDAVKWDMLEEWDRTRRAPRHAAWMHEHELKV